MVHFRRFKPPSMVHFRRFKLVGGGGGRRKPDSP